MDTYLHLVYLFYICIIANFLIFLNFLISQLSAKMLLLLLVSLIAASCAHPQSNYADQANNIAYIGEGLPPEATLGGKVTQLDDLSPEIKLNKTRADLNCAAGSMQVRRRVIFFFIYVVVNIIFLLCLR